jgi:copper chaperone NosL
MKKITRIGVLVISLLLITGYFMPLWDISLEAPQYPEGISLQIWVNKITGDLQTINGLNHYIGMKAIEPDSIPELKLMPYILGFLILLGLITALINKKWMLYLWVLFFVTLGAAGAYDFWKWEYDYGHNLDPTAAIKVPGMNYQPPLIGEKELLNFTAASWPGIAGWILIAGGLTALGLMIYELKNRPRTEKVKVKEKIPAHDKLKFSGLLHGSH